MNIRLYKVVFDESASNVDDLYSYLSDIDKQKILHLEITSSFHCYHNENYCGYILITPKSMKDYKNVLSNNLIPYLCEDLSTDVIDNKINLEEELFKYTDHSNYKDYDDFILEMNIWIIENLNLDLILDRISLRGIDSLRPIDKEFLKTI